ncbi:MAG TPA: CHASE2 domain-containing protein [Chitinophagaceae bacterium]|nr:CHASE2 domain-containing protein [Chitinophagaceae bacterium]
MKRPLHKHIAYHFKNAHKRVTKYLYERDTIFATAWVFAFILMVKVLPLPNIHFFDPVEIALEDFDFNDIAYSKLKKSQGNPVDNRIVIINIGYADREGIASLIEKTASMQPKVMGLDAEFHDAKDPHKDSVLSHVFQQHSNLVVVSRLDWEEKKYPEQEPGYFGSDIHQRGYGNFISEEKGTIRLFSPFEKSEHETYPSFAAALVKNYDSSAFIKLQKRHKEVETINYSRRTNQYLVIEGDDLLNGNVDDSAIRGKIVLLGYVNNNPFDIEDKLFTPMNEKFAGKSTPDMNGIVIHANIISMMLDGNYINKLPLWATILFAVLIGWLHMSFFIHYYLENHIWFHLVAKFAQLVSAIVFVYLGMYLFDRFRIKLDMTLTIIVIVLAVDIIYFYEAFAVWLHKKFNYKTVFHQKHH